MPKEITKETQRSYTMYACEECGKEFDSPSQAKFCEDVHWSRTLPTLRCGRYEFIYIDNTKEATRLGDSLGAHYAGWGRPLAAGWYFLDITENYEDGHVLLLTPMKDQITKWESEVAELATAIGYFKGRL